MKLFGYILAFYLILLSGVPCCAVDNCPDDKMDLSAGADHEKGDEDCGNCSPFFSCEGCATASIAYQPVQLEITTPLIASGVYAAYIQTSLPSVNYDFWQPPRACL